MSSLSSNRRTLFLACGLVLLAALCVLAWFLYSDSGKYEILTVNPDRALYPVRGADISAHNGIVDFEALKADSVDFVILKATEGATFKDRMFVNNYRRARRAGLIVGVYHFFRFDTPGYLQALNILNSLDGHPSDMPVLIDLEESGNPRYVDPDTAMSRLGALVETLRERGHRIVIYTNKQGLRRFFPQGFPKDYDLWICSFSNPPLASGEPWTLWQHTHRGSLDGVEGAVDIDTFNGSLEEFLKWLNAETYR